MCPCHFLSFKVSTYTLIKLFCNHFRSFDLVWHWFGQKTRIYFVIYKKFTNFSTKIKNDRNWVKNYMQVKQTVIIFGKFLKYLLNKEIIKRSNTICSKGRMCWTIWSFFPSSTWYLLPCRAPCLKCSHLCPNRICWKFTEPSKFLILISFIYNKDIGPNQ